MKLIKNSLFNQYLWNMLYRNLILRWILLLLGLSSKITILMWKSGMRPLKDVMIKIRGF